MKNMVCEVDKDFYPIGLGFVKKYMLLFDIILSLFNIIF